MTASSDFLPFATGAGANVESQASYAADAIVPAGFSAGVASSAKVNKVMRQSSFVSAAIANFMATQLNTNIADDGNLSEFVTNFGSALAAAFMPVAGGTFTGAVSGPTAGAGDNTTNLATTAFVQAAITTLAALALGATQTWQNVTGSRASGTTYTNGTGKPIQVLMVFPDTTSLSPVITVVVGGVTLINAIQYDGGASVASAIPSFIVPPGATYSVTWTLATGVQWNELR